MNMSQALNILRPDSKDDLKASYKRAALKYHPDHGGDLEMMKLVNLAYEFLKNNDWHTGEMRRRAKREAPILDEIKAVWDLIKSMPEIKGEQIGIWLWVTGNTKKYKTELKKAGLKWSPKKFAWYWKPAGSRKVTKKQFDLNELRNIFGSEDLENETLHAIG